MDKRAWDEYEAAKLIELRQRMDDMEPDAQDEAVASLSEVLQRYVMSYGMTKEFAESKRGAVRIRQRMAMVEYVLTDGRAGIKTVSEPLIHAAQLFQQDKAAYWDLLTEANQRMGEPQAEMPMAWVVSAEPASLEWEECELAALMDIYFRLQDVDPSQWDGMMQEFSDCLACYQEGKQGCTEEILEARDLEHVGEAFFLMRMMLGGASGKGLGAPPLMEKVLGMMERQPWAYEALLKEAKKRIPGLS